MDHVSRRMAVDLESRRGELACLVKSASCFPSMAHGLYLDLSNVINGRLN